MLNIKKIANSLKGSSMYRRLIIFIIPKILTITKIFRTILPSIMILIREAEKRVLILLWKLLNTASILLKALTVGNPSTSSE